MDNFGGSGSTSLGFMERLKMHDVSLYLIHLGKRCLHHAVPLCAGHSSTANSGEVFRTEKGRTFPIRIGNQNRHDLWHAHQEGESTNHGFALS